MSPEEPQTNPGATPASTSSSSAGGATAEKTTSPSVGRRVPVWVLTVAAAIAAVLSWLGGEVTQNLFPVTIEIPPEVARMGPGYEKQAKLSELEGQARRV